MPQQYLRVRRRRNACTASMLQMEGLMEDSGRKKRPRGTDDDDDDGGISEQLPVESLAGLSLERTQLATAVVSQEYPDDVASPRRKRRSAVWRKVATISEPDQWKAATAYTSTSSNISGNKRTSVVVTDAVLDDDSSSSSSSSSRNQHQGALAIKRRRLILVDTSLVEHQFKAMEKMQPNNNNNNNSNSSNNTPHKNKSSPRHGYKVLNPIQRLVDDSLQQVAAGNRTAAQHLQFVCHDERMSSAPTTSSSSWLLWCNAETGNLLHCCAMWNQVETAHELLSRVVVQQQQPNNNNNNNTAARLLHAVDGQGRTPYQVADLSGHDGICQILAAFDDHHGRDQDGNRNDYVFDVYCLDESSSRMEDDSCNALVGVAPTTTTTAAAADAPEASPAKTAVVAACANNDPYQEEVTMCELQGGVGYWDDRSELVLEIPPGYNNNINNNHQSHRDDEQDSNSETWQGNDYPEDGQEEGSDSEDDQLVRDSFRHCAIHLTGVTIGSDQEEKEFTHDAAYGIYGPDEEYDSEC